jgi:phage protein D
MQPICRITSAGKDVTTSLGDRLISVDVTDEAESKSDSVSITIDDRARYNDAAVVALPIIGSIVEVTLGYKDGVAVSMGSYLIDDLKIQSPPRQLCVSGRSAAMNKSFRTPKTKSYHQMTFGAIMKEIAGRNGYEAKVDPALSGIVIRHIDQHNESDMAFASRLAAMHDGVAKPVSGKLAAAKRGTGKSITGGELPVVTLNENQMVNWHFIYSARDEAGEAGGLEGEGEGGTDQQSAGDSGLSQSDQFTGDIISPEGSGGDTEEKGGVRAYWVDIRSGEKKEVVTGKEPYHDLRYTYHNEAEATAATDAYSNQSKRGRAAFSCTIVGDPTVQAEAKLILQNIRPYIPAEWRIKSVKHHYDASGYQTDIDAELFTEKQADVPSGVKKTKPTDDDKIDPDAPAEPVEPDAPTGGGDIIDLPE